MRPLGRLRVTAVTFQSLIVLLLAALSAQFILRGLLRKDCAPGCGSCPSKACAFRELEARLKAEAKRSL
jgi:hypothetical protein